MKNKDTRYIILSLLFVFSVIIDSINGYLQIQREIVTPIGLLFRITVMGLVISVLARRYKITSYLFISIFIVSLFCSIWSILYGASFFEEFSVLTRIAYTPLMIYFFYNTREYYDKERLYKYISNYGLIISVLIIFSFVFGIGNSSYDSDYTSFGTKAFFRAGNDLGLTIVFSLIIACTYHVQNRGSFYSFIRCVVIALGGVLIGSRVGMILCSLILILFLLYNIIHIKSNKSFIVFSSLLALILAFYTGRIIYDSLGDWALARFGLESMQNTRSDYKEEAVYYIKSFDSFASIVGEGYGNLAKSVAKGLSLDMEEKSIEADWHEMIGSYGFFLGGLIILLYIILFIKGLKRFVKYKSIEYFSYMIILFLFVVISFIAGHTFSNVMAAPIYGFVAARVISPKATIRNHI